MPSLEKDNWARACARMLVFFGLPLVLLASLVFDARAAVTLYDFVATAQSDGSILVVWTTATELNTVAFRLYRSESASGHGDQPVNTQSAKGDRATGAEYSYKDTAVTSGVRYYYYLEELLQAGPGDHFGPVNACIDTANACPSVPTPTPTATATVAPATATATATTIQSGATATRTPTATSVSAATSGDQPTATRQFANTPRPGLTVPGSTPTPPSPAPATAVPIGSGVVSTPTGGPQRPPTAVPVSAAATPAAVTPLPPAAPAGPAASPSPEIAATSVVQPALEFTPSATPPPQVFAAATTQPLLGTPGRAAADPTPAPAGEATRNTRSMLLLGGGAIVLAAALGGGVLLLLRSRRQ